MPIEVKDGMDLVNGTGVVGGVIAVITTFGWWLRRERAEKASTDSAVSSSHAAMSASESHAKQIEALTKRVNEQGELIITLVNEINHLKNRLAARDAARVGIRVLLSSLSLDLECEQRNRPILDEVERLLKDD
jgi:hypothetical protein